MACLFIENSFFLLYDPLDKWNGSIPEVHWFWGVSKRRRARDNIGLFVIWSPSFLVIRRGVVRGDGI